MLEITEYVDKKIYKKNLKKIIVETVLSSIGAACSVATVTIFWNSVGMDQTAIGFVQMMFTIVLCCLDIPMGYLADRFNRKVLNIIGDIGVALVFAIYAFSRNMYMVLLSECLLAIFMAITNGVDQSFIKYNCNKIDETGELFKKTNIKVHTLRYVALLIATALGGFIAKFSLRLTIGIAFIPYFIGGLIAIGIKDYGEQLEVKHNNPIKDMIYTIKEIIKEKNTKVYLASYILGKEVTHAQIWVFTPLLILVGVPIEIVSVGWILNYMMQIIGGKVSEKMIKFETSNKFAIPMLIEFSWIIILLFHTNIVTVWLFALNGFVHGLTEGTLMTVLQESAKDEIQTSLMSVASTGARLLYIPLVYIVNYLGDIKLQYALLGVLYIFLPLSIITYTKLKQIDVKRDGSQISHF